MIQQKTCIVLKYSLNTYLDVLNICLEMMPKKRTNSTKSIAQRGERSYDHHMFTPDQLRAARALLNWSQDDLASTAEVAVMMIKNYERRLSDPRLSSMTKLKQTLEAAGIEFIDATENSGPGVRWSSPEGTNGRRVSGE